MAGKNWTPSPVQGLMRFSFLWICPDWFKCHQTQSDFSRIQGQKLHQLRKIQPYIWPFTYFDNQKWYMATPRKAYTIHYILQHLTQVDLDLTWTKLVLTVEHWTTIACELVELYYPLTAAMFHNNATPTQTTTATEHQTIQDLCRSMYNSRQIFRGWINKFEILREHQTGSRACYSIT